MKIHRAFAILITMLVLTDPASTLAQERSTITFEGNFGWGTGRTSGEYMNNRDGLTANALVAGRMHRSSAWSVIAGMDASAFGSGPYDAICLPASGGRCVPAFPSFWVFSGLAGIETVRGTLRAMVGAGYARPTRRLTAANVNAGTFCSPLIAMARFAIASAFPAGGQLSIAGGQPQFRMYASEPRWATGLHGGVITGMNRTYVSSRGL